MPTFTITVTTDIASDAPTIAVATTRTDLRTTRHALVALDAGATDYTADVASVVRMHLAELDKL